MSSIRLTRRRFLHAAAGTAAAALAGCRRTPPRAGPYSGQQLRIFIYSTQERTMRDVFVPRFEEQTGATALLDTGWWDSIAKLKESPKGKPAFDLVITDATQGYPALKEGLFQQLDLARIPNRLNLAPCVLDNWVYKEGYGVTYPDSVMTLAYHKQRAPFEPTKWGDLLNDRVRGKIGLYNSFYMSLYTFACMKVDLDGKPGTAAAEVNNNLAGVLAFAKEQRERVQFWWPTSTDMLIALTQQNTVVGNMHSPEMLRALRERPELGAVVPDDDRAFVQVMWVVPDGTPHKALAEEAINMIFSEDVQRGFARQGSATAVPAVAQQLAAEDPLWKQFYPHTEAQLKSLTYYPYDAYLADWKHISDVWDRQILRKG